MSTRLIILSVATALVTSLLRLPVYAQIPTPTPTGVEVAGDIVDARYDLTWVKNEIINITSVIPGLGDRFAEWASRIRPTDDVHDVPNLEKYGDWLSRSDPGLTPKTIRDETVDFTTQQLKTYTSRLCVVDYKTGGMAVDMVSNRRIESEPIEWINPLDQHGERFNSYIGRRKQPDQNYDRPSEIVDLNSARPCTWQDSALNVRKIQLDTSDINQYGTGTGPITTLYSALDFIVSIFEKIEQGITSVFADTHATINGWILFTERLSHAEPMCNIFGCESSDLTAAPIDAQEKEQLAKDKGFVLTYKPRVLSYRNNINSARPNSFTTNTGRTQTIETRTYLTKGTKDSLDYLTCTLIPKVKQGEVMGEDYQDTECKYQETAVCEDKTLPDLSGTDASCNLCNTDGIPAFIASVNPDYMNQLPEGNLPQVAIDILNKAASTYQVPAPVLLGAMIQEGAFTWDDWQWTSENVLCWSVEGGKIGQTTFGDDASCMSHAHPATGSRGAFGWIDTRFAPYSDAVHAVDPGRTELDQCNFMDAAFATAKSMSDTQGGSSSTPSSCNGITLLQNAGRRNCSAWDDSRAGTAQYTYNGSCTAAVPRTVNAFRQFKCF